MKKMSLFLAALVVAVLYSVQNTDATSLHSRSTITCAAESYLLVATGTINVTRIIVASPTVNNDSFITIHNSTTSTFGVYHGPNASTGIGPLSTNVTPVISAWPGFVDYRVPLSSGMVINKVGNACTEIIYEFAEPYTVMEENPLGRTPILPYVP